MCLEELGSKCPNISSQNIWPFRELLFINACILAYTRLQSVDSVLKCMFWCCDEGGQNVCLSQFLWSNLWFDVGLENRLLSNLIYFFVPSLFLRAVRSGLIALTGQPMRKTFLCRCTMSAVFMWASGGHTVN